MLSKIKRTLVKLKPVFSRRSVAIPLQIVLVGLAIGLAFFALPTDTGSVKLSEFEWSSIAAGVVCYLAFFAFLSVHWAYALSIIENSKVQLTQVFAFFASQPYKYLPSSIFSMSARTIYSKKLGAESIMSTAKAQLVEYGSIFASGLIVLVLAKTGFSAIAIVVACIVLSGYLTYEMLYATRNRGRIYKLCVLLVIAFVSWLLAGASFYYIVEGVGDRITYQEALFTNTAAFLASIAAIFVPAGIGIREAILFSQNVGFAGTIIWRVCSIVVDIATGLAAIIMINKRPSGPKK